MPLRLLDHAKRGEEKGVVLQASAFLSECLMLGWNLNCKALQGMALTSIAPSFRVAPHMVSNHCFSSTPSLFEV